MSELVLEGFAGPGGWSTGLRTAGFTGTAVGVEWDAAACRTAVAAGHLRVRADVAAFPLEHLAGKVAGAILSPPCQAWSNAGDQLGKLDQGKVHERIAHFARGETPPGREWADERSMLTAEPMRWAYALRPRWIALEQVPPVLPLWQYTAELLRGLGYRTWTGKLDAECYGVPQTRDRAILVARRDGLPVGPPPPTHQAYRKDRAYDTGDGLFGEQLPPPVSMAEAIGWGLPDRPAWTVEWRMHPAGLTGSYQYSRPVNEPAPTIKGSGRQYVSDDHVSVALSVQESAILQSFSADYPWTGTKDQQHEQVGNAVPPLRAAAILRPFIHSSAREVAA
jgi:DNA (cytosine-5)-methyltransferase 1